MKRGAKLGCRRSAERVLLEMLSVGDEFYSIKKDKDLTALSSVCSVKIKTENSIIINPKTLHSKKIIKVTILEKQISHYSNDDEIIRLQNIGIEMANDIEQKRKEIESLKEQLAIASEQVPKGAFEFNHLEK